MLRGIDVYFNYGPVKENPMNIERRLMVIFIKVEFDIKVEEGDTVLEIT